MAFMKDCIISNEIELYDPISKKKLKTFSALRKLTKVSIKGKEQILRADRNLFARMTVIAQTRDMNMREVLKYTLCPLPWSLATPKGLYVKTSKYKLAEVLEKDVDPCAEEPDISVYILDGMALLQSIQNVPRTFGNLAEYILKLIIRTARNAVRVDFVTNICPELSVKNLERSKRAAGGSYAVKISFSPTLSTKVGQIFGIRVQ